MQGAHLTATLAAAQAIEHLRESYGPLSIFQSAGCCDGSLPMCVTREELPPGPGDELLGVVSGTPFYIDAEMNRRWGHPPLLLDVRAGDPEGLSLGPPGAHFVTTQHPLDRGSARSPAAVEHT